MALDRVHSSETQLFYTGVRIPAIQSIEFSTDKSSTDLRPLGELSYKERILNANQTTNLSYSILVTTGASGFDPFYTFQQQDEGFLSTGSFGFNIKDFAGENTITGAYLSSYSLEGSVGDFVRGSVSYEADSISYNTAKGGLINMTRVLAVELAEKNILVNSVAPGFINTPMSIMKDGSLEWDTDWFNDVYLKYEKLPMGRYGHPDDIAGAVYFFCSDDSKYVTGQTLLVDGGVSVTF